MNYSKRILCEICNIINLLFTAGEELCIRDGAYRRTAFRVDQEYLGTVFMTAKRHVDSLVALAKAEEYEFIELRNRMIAVQMREFGAKVVNVSCLMNMTFDKGGAGSPHVHYHLKPRYHEPVSRFGYTFIDYQFGSYIKNKYPNDVDHETAKEIADLLRTAAAI